MVFADIRGIPFFGVRQCVVFSHSDERFASMISLNALADSASLSDLPETDQNNLETYWPYLQSHKHFVFKAQQTPEGFGANDQRPLPP